MGLELADLSNLDLLIDRQSKQNQKEDKVPEITQNPFSKLGDVWVLDKHRIICGDSLKQETYEKLFSDSNKKAQMIFTDPPYNVKIDKHVCGIGKIKHREFAMASGEMTTSEFTSFLTSVLQNLKNFSLDGSLHYICMGWRHMKELFDSGLSIYDELKNLCIWNKDNGGRGSLYRSKHELVFIFKNAKESHVNNVELGKNGRYRANVWDYFKLEDSILL